MSRAQVSLWTLTAVAVLAAGGTAQALEIVFKGQIQSRIEAMVTAAW
jgi:hypothetical protein